MKLPGIIISLLISSLIYGQSSTKGNLVIVGGGLEPDNKSIYEDYISFAGGKEYAKIAVIPAAGGVPMQSFVIFKSTLMSYGIPSDHIYLINIAMIDDDSTTNVDESTWSKNANNVELADIVNECTAVWFTGGDQLRTTQTMKNEDGTNSLVLEAVWELYNKGGVIGGTSAGAAIMSEVMIGDGNSLSALKNGVSIYDKAHEFKPEDGVLVTKGLGFFPGGIVDQHFQQRNRLGRLIVTLLNSKDSFNRAFGVDENTALIYLSGENKIKVAGESGVTIIDTKFVEASPVNYNSIENLRLSNLENGDSFDLTTNTITPAEGKKATVGSEYYDHIALQEGIFSDRASGFSDLITKYVIVIKTNSFVQNIIFTVNEKCFLVKFSKLPESEGYYIDNEHKKDGYTVGNIRMDITAVGLSISPINK